MKYAEHSNVEWIELLNSDHPHFSQTLRELRMIILGGLRRSFGRNSRVPEDRLDDFCQESLMRILDRIETFAGEARFTTWATKVAVNLVLAEIRKKSWQNVSLDSMENPEPLFNPEKGYGLFSSVEKKVMRKELTQLCNRMIRDLLTEKQKTALTFRMKFGMPLDEVARRMESNRNSTYKLLHDARKKLKQGLIAAGVGSSDLVDLE